MSTIICIIIPLAVLTYISLFQNQNIISAVSKHSTAFTLYNPLIVPQILLDIPIYTGNKQPHVISKIFTAPQWC